ncbi:hypothetical protein K474DRAFT_1658315 [Panus rudis PR-1116 ss-1]|nr:hypothetical protein K474DRAFT_1658315 [Panus rudis PR-1116 ss-1]
MAKGKKSKSKSSQNTSQAHVQSTTAIPVCPSIGAAVAPSAPPLPNPATGSANPAASFSALWGYLQPALDHIVRSPTNNTAKAPAIDVAYHMGIHTAVYNYFTSQSEVGMPQHPAEKMASFAAMTAPRTDKAKASGTDLYDQLDRYYAEIAREVFLGTPHDDASLIHYLVPCFNRYSAGVRSVDRLLNYVNRHYVKRAVDEDRGWFRLTDMLDVVTKMIQEDDTREKIQTKLKEMRVQELKKWGYSEGGSPEELAQAEACAEAASKPDRIVHLVNLGYRRFRIECIEPLLTVPKTAKRNGKRNKIPSSNSQGPQMPKGRLARAVKELLEGQGGDLDERRRLAGELAMLLKTVGVRFDHPLRKKLEKFCASPPPTSAPSPTPTS